MLELLNYTTSKQFLDYFKVREPSFRVQHFSTLPRYWIEYAGKDYEAYIRQYGYVNHREIMPFELCLDIDVTKELSIKDANVQAKILGDDIERVLKIMNYSYLRWSTGGASRRREYRARASGR